MLEIWSPKWYRSSAGLGASHGMYLVWQIYPVTDPIGNYLALLVKHAENIMSSLFRRLSPIPQHLDVQWEI